MTAARSDARTSGQRAVIPRQRDKLLLTAEEAAQALGVGRSTMYGLIRDGAVASVRIGRLRRVPAESLVEYVDRLRKLNVAQ